MRIESGQQSQSPSLVRLFVAHIEVEAFLVDEALDLTGDVDQVDSVLLWAVPDDQVLVQWAVDGVSQDAHEPLSRADG